MEQVKAKLAVDQATKEKRLALDQEIMKLPLIKWEGQIKVLQSKLEMEQAIQHILASGEKHVGLDVETKPVFRKGEWNPPALVQIATEKCVYLFRVCKITTISPLLPLFEDSNIQKTGIGIRGDVAELQKVTKFTPGGFVEITKITRDELNIDMLGLRALTAHFMKGRISKDSQLSNWAQPTLTQKQIEYAATDAWVSRQVYHLANESLKDKNVEVDPDIDS